MARANPLLESVHGSAAWGVTQERYQLKHFALKRKVREGAGVRGSAWVKGRFKMCLDLIHLTKKLFPAIEDNSLLNPPAHTQAAGTHKPSWKWNDVSKVFPHEKGNGLGCHSFPWLLDWTATAPWACPLGQQSYTSRLCSQGIRIWSVKTQKRANKTPEVFLRDQQNKYKKNQNQKPDKIKCVSFMRISKRNKMQWHCKKELLSHNLSLSSILCFTST